MRPPLGRKPGPAATLLRERLESAGLSYQYLDGSTPMAQRTQRVNAFQAGQDGGGGTVMRAADMLALLRGEDGADGVGNPT